jgi:hypothetical protein
MGAAVDTHLQQLPGGLDVLIGTERIEASTHQVITHLFGRAKEPGARDVLIDLGRLPPSDPGGAPLLEGTDEIALVSKSDAASVVGLRQRAAPLVERFGHKLSLVLVGPRHHADEEVRSFTGVRLLGRAPFDRSAAAMVSGERHGRRRLSRSGLVVSAARLASELAQASATAVPTSSPP